MPVVTTTKNLESIQIIEWPTPKVLAFSTTRLKPNPHLLFESLSKNISHNARRTDKSFDYFNLGAHVGDDLEHVSNNRNALLKFLPNGTKIQWLEQVHGSHVAHINSHIEQAIVADAAITRHKNIALAIMTADCLPILLADKNGYEIAAIHAGWRPLAANIIKNTVCKMQTPAKDLCAWLGPCIGSTAFEVGEEVKQAFAQISEEFIPAFLPLMNEDNKPKYLADIAMIAKIQLQNLGIANISHTYNCTFTEHDKYYSFRRDGKTGRMASIISLI